ncbi:hypothetical protein M5E88_12265 [Akkermansia muciniphila]|nr:hypothetical protein M5E88_12265 [Akkermansia muciniphila]
MKDVANATARLKGRARIPPVYDSSSGSGEDRTFRRCGRSIYPAGKGADVWPDMASGWETGKSGDEKGRSPERERP